MRRGAAHLYISTIGLGLALAAAALAGAPREARAYGVATHAWLAEEAAQRIAARDPALAFLATDADARACFVYGAMLPDMRSTAPQAAAFDRVRSQVLASGFVTDVRFSTAGVDTVFRGFDTHGSAFLLSLVDRARASGDRLKLAFALGNLTHVMQDKHAQVFHIPAHIQGLHCGDLGVEPVEDPATAASWYPGAENELFFEAAGDLARPATTLAFVRDAPWRLASNPYDSYARALALRRFYWEGAAAFQSAQGRTPPTESAIQNACQIFEVSLTFYPLFTGHDDIADSMRLFGDRYLVLAWWAAALTGIVQAITTNFTGGRDLFDVIGPLVLPQAGRQIGGRSPAAEIVFAHGRGGAEEQRVRAKYAANPEYARLLASGILERATHAAQDYEGAHVFAVDGCVRGGASLYTDDVRWPRYVKTVMRGAGIRSLLRASGADAVAEAPKLLVYAVDYRDAATGADLAEVRVPADVGKRLRVVAELFGADRRPEARLVRVRLRAHTGLGPQDPVLASVTRLIPARLLDLAAYGSVDRPAMAVEWTIADVPGAIGLYVEIDERRLAPERDDAAADLLLTTEMTRLAPLIQGRPHYDRHYATYGGGTFSSLPVRR